MKILLAHKFHYLTGGAEIFYFEISRILKKNGHEIAFFTTEDDRNINTGDKVYTVPPPNYKEGGVIAKLSGSRDIFYSQNKKSDFQKAIDDFCPDVIHVFAIHVHLTPAILEAAKESDVPVLMSCNDYKHICPNYKLYDGDNICEACKGGKYYNAILKRCCKDSTLFTVASTIEAYIHEYKKVYDRFVDRFLFSSEFMLNKTKEFWSDKHIDYGVLKNPFDASSYQPVYGGSYALYFGRIIDEKGVDCIIEAAKQVKVPIKIVGDGPDLERLKKLSSDFDLTHVEFMGAKWGDDLKTILTGSKFVIVPSLWHENFPYVIFQSFAAGKPVIGSLRGGIPELIGLGRGLLFEPNHTGELAKQIELFWTDDALCESMGMLAREYVTKEFSDDVIYESLMNNYKAVLQ